jgi:hypothetical protein
MLLKEFKPFLRTGIVQVFSDKVIIKNKLPDYPEEVVFNLFDIEKISVTERDPNVPQSIEFYGKNIIGNYLIIKVVFPLNHNLLISIKNLIDPLIESSKSEKNEKDIEERRMKNEENRIKELERIRLLNLNKLEITNELDKDGNKEVDLIDGESFNKLLTKNQKIIIEIDKNYIQKFVKISMYLKTKKSNTQKIFDSIKDTKNDTELNELVNLLKNQIHTYELLVFHSISMITSLVDSDLISFYEIYECFDQLGVFNSNWENDVSGKLSNIGEGIKDLMYSIYHMEQSIVNSLDNLSYVTQDSFQDLRNSIDSQLSSIDSSIQCNNLLTGIQTYQMYKINQNTKRIN